MTSEMELVGVRVDMPSNTPVMLLRELEGDRRMLAIMIGGPEAQAIAFALDGVETRRPLTHDLITLLLDELDAHLDRIVISALRDDVYYADLHLQVGEQVHVVSARPSDAMAIAVRVGTPVFADEAVLAEAGYLDVPDDEDLEDDDEVVEEFREFIDQVNPEDFAS
ncbi:bifunctional nuclease family protein [Acidimicrobiia bacterium EGI L10123]|uniref:bifunctional nuclease family protein n=1 Tax=Salinilacustrithrix flava TaxID=2957203 RepID=UPI003D7C2686|nr:bifunctional nuclease family protein [Acidimicrobiia bacterium EGI L10123]